MAIEQYKVLFLNTLLIQQKCYIQLTKYLATLYQMENTFYKNISWNVWIAQICFCMKRSSTVQVSAALASSKDIMNTCGPPLIWSPNCFDVSNKNVFLHCPETVKNVKRCSKTFIIHNPRQDREISSLNIVECQNTCNCFVTDY